MIIIYKLFGIKLLKQAMMRKVLYALAPVIIGAVYFFGWRVLLVIGTALLAGAATEWVFVRRNDKPISEAVLVSVVLYALTLPVRTPLLIVAIGIVFGIVFGKMVFGGFGRNVFNPALVGRAFIYVNFPAFLTGQWTKPFADGLGGFGAFIGEYVPADALASATPMLLYRSAGQVTDAFKLLIGNIGGSIGETSAIIIILAGIYLIYSKTASWEIMVAMLAGFTVADSAFYLLGATSVPNPLVGILSGGVLFAAVFMATDPISSPKTREAKFIYGILIGVVTVVIRGFALFAGGVMFAVLIGNTFGPILDELVKYLKQKKKKVEVTHG